MGGWAQSPRAEVRHYVARHFVALTQDMVRRYVALTQDVAIRDAAQPERESRDA